MTNHHKKTSPRCSPKVHERAVRLVFDHAGEYASQWAAIESIAAKIGCAAQTLHTLVARAGRNQGVKPGAASEGRERLKQLERENRELRQTNEILRKASAYFAPAELGVEPICRVLPIAPSTITVMRTVAPIRIRHRPGSNAMQFWRLRSKGFSMRTSVSTACANLGDNCCATALMSCVARSRGS